MNRWRLGRIDVAAIVDAECFEIDLTRIFPSGSADALAGQAWLEPDHADLARSTIKLGMHSFLLRTPTLNILIDTCIGADKPRPAHNAWHQRRSMRFVDDLRAQGLTPEDIDLVFCTHLHADHVGWNTRLLDGRWVPTFPNARYAMSRQEFEQWRTAQAASEAPVNHGAFRDSLLPVEEHGQALFADVGEVLTPGIEIVALAGHTSDHRGLQVRHDGGCALFCGDAIHSPVQLVHPHWASAFCGDPDVAVATRLAMLERVAQDDVHLFPAHFRGSRMVRIRPVGDGYRLA